MFTDEKENFLKIEGCYKKIKSIYFYSKDKLFERIKISQFEDDKKRMVNTFKCLAHILCKPNSPSSRKQIEQLISGISFRIFPKKFYGENRESEIVTSNVQKKDLTNVNFLIDMPIELMLLDCLWTLLIGKIAYDNGSISQSNYANKLDNMIFYRKQDLEIGIDYKSNRLFKPYFKQYSNWRNRAIETISQKHQTGNDTILLSLDLKSYFYSVNFDFKKLNTLLNNDERINDFLFLTNIIQQIYQKYTEKIIELRTDTNINISKGHVLFPFQLCSSCLLANLFLKNFDSNIEDLSDVLFYGRYVDDILIVLNNTLKCKNRKTILEKFLVEKNIIEEQESNSYCIPQTDVKFNSEKIKIFAFFCQDPKALINFMKEKMFINASSVDFYNVDYDFKPFNNEVYYQEKYSGYSKFKDLDILMSDNYNATKYLYHLLNLNRNVSESFDTENESILEFYRGTSCLEFRSSWVLVLYLGVLQKNRNFITEFYKLIQIETEQLSAKELKDIISSKKSDVLKKIKESILDEFDVAMAIALSLNSSLVIQKPKIKEYTRLIKNANMFNHKLVSYPLLNYTTAASNNDFSLIETDLEKLSRSEMELDEFKLHYSPRFIHFEEINLFHFIKQYRNGGDVYHKSYEELYNQFQEINNISTYCQISSDYDDCHLIETINYNMDWELENVCVGITSIKIEEEEVMEQLKNPDKFLTVKNKRRLFHLLQEGEQNLAKIIVFPEFYLPIAWISEIANYAKSKNITIVSGVQLLKYKKRAYNYIVNIQPFYTDRRVKYKNVFTHIREKNDYSLKEKDNLKKLGFHVKDSPISILTIYSFNNKFKYCNRVCYEFTDITSRANLKNKVELIIVPEFNMDTNYFSNIIESTARDNLCFIAQSNTSIYGDSRILGPYSTNEKNLIRVKGGENDIIIVDNLDILPLIKFKYFMEKNYNYKIANQKANGEKDFKKPSARFFD